MLCMSNLISVDVGPAGFRNYTKQDTREQRASKLTLPGGGCSFFIMILFLISGCGFYLHEDPSDGGERDVVQVQGLVERNEAMKIR